MLGSSRSTTPTWRAGERSRTSCAPIVGGALLAENLSRAGRRRALHAARRGSSAWADPPRMSEGRAGAGLFVRAALRLARRLGMRGGTPRLSGSPSSSSCPGKPCARLAELARSSWTARREAVDFSRAGEPAASRSALQTAFASRRTGGRCCREIAGSFDRWSQVRELAWRKGRADLGLGLRGAASPIPRGSQRGQPRLGPRVAVPPLPTR